jgi:hypothetical protein
VRRAALLALLLSVLLVSPGATQTAGSGSWTSMGSLPFFPTAMHLLPTGKVLFFGGDTQGSPAGSPATTAMAWDPATGQTSTLAPPGYDLFCAGHSYLADGRLLFTGGHIANFIGLANATAYDATANRWTPLANMNAGRWYPTNTTLPSGDVLVVSGQTDTTVGVDTLPQVFDAAAGTWRDLSSAQLALDLYPRMHVAPNGKVFNSGPSATTRYLDTGGTGAWTVVANRGAGYRDYASSVMYDTGKILFAGGGDPPTGATEAIDLNSSSPSWRTVGSMATPRRHHNATLLPDGKVLVTGGTSGSGFNDTSRPVFAAEMWDPATERWTTLASQTVGRFYHSVALLLPDGRVMSAGGNGHPEVEVFSPPYLSAGARPTITSVPGSVGYGQSFSVQTPDAAAVQQVTLVRLPAVTHAFDQNQRFNRLTFTRASDALAVTAPGDANVAPPGHYMLFVLNGQGVPSVAKMIQLGGATAPPPTGTGLTLTSLSPSTAAPGSPAFTLTVNGANFVSGSTVRWNGAARTTTFVSSTQLTAAIPASDVAAAAEPAVTVTNPAPNAATSNALTFVVSASASPGGPPLQVYITQPSPGATLSGTAWVTVWLDGTTGSSNRLIAMLGGQTPAGTATSSSAGPISFPIDTTVAADGTRTLTVSATDAAGHTGSGSISVTTKNGITAPPGGGGGTPLTAAITAPAAGSTVTGTVDVTMSASGGTSPYRYTLAVDSTQLVANAASGTVSWNTTGVANGAHTLTATVTDAAGATAPATASVTVSNPTAPPPPSTGTLQVYITQPANGATVSGVSWVTLWLEGSSGTSNTYTLTVAGLEVAATPTSSRGPVSLAWDTTAVPNGAQTLTASARDATGNTGSSSIAITVSNAGSPPPPPPPAGLAASITSPASGSTLSGTVNIAVSGSGGTPPYTYSVTAGGTALLTDSSSSTVAWDTTRVADGTQSIGATVRDSTGATAPANATVMVSNSGGTPPPATGTLEVYITQPSSGATVRGTVWVVVWLGGASGSSNSYTLSVGGRSVAAENTGSTGPVSLPWTSTAADNGARTLTVTVRDATGNSGTGSISVTVGN